MENYNNETVSKNLKAMRARSGLNQADVAKRLGVSVLTFRRYEDNPEKVSIGIFLKLADIYGCTPRIFFMEW